MDNRFRPLRAILFLVVTIALLVLAYVFVMRIDFGGASRVTVRFSSVGTIQSGSPVRQSGVKVGTVARVGLAQDDRKSVDVVLSLGPGRTVHAEDHIAIVTSGLLGDQYVDIAPGSDAAPVVGPDEILHGEGGLDLKGLVDNGSVLVRDLGQSSQIVSTLLSGHTDSFNRILADTERGIHQAAQAAEKVNLLMDHVQASWPDVQATLQSLRSTSAELDSAVQKLTRPGSLVDWSAQPETKTAVQATVENLQAVTQNLLVVTNVLEKALR